MGLAETHAGSSTKENASMEIVVNMITDVLTVVNGVMVVMNAIKGSSLRRVEISRGRRVLNNRLVL